MKLRYGDFADLVGEEVSAVCFIRDYVGLQFDGPTLHLLQPLSIKTKDGDFSFPGPGARDALCDMIGATVIHVEVVIPEKFVMTTSSGHTVSMGLAVRNAPDAGIDPVHHARSSG